MVMLLFIAALTLFFAREISGYDRRYNVRKYFILKNKEVARLLLPKTLSVSRSAVKRSQSDFNKMTYAGAIFYFCNLVLILSIPIFLFLVPEIQVQSFEINTRLIYISADTLNQKLPVLLFLMLLVAEAIFELFNEIVQTRKQNKKWVIILCSILMVIIFLFGLMLIKELVSTFVEVFSQ